jgi:hypothetical protein
MTSNAIYRTKDLMRNNPTLPWTRQLRNESAVRPWMTITAQCLAPRTVVLTGAVPLPTGTSRLQG